MAIIQRQQFLGMDKDTEPGFMQPGMYQYALNCHVGSSERGNIGSVENVKGNTLVSFSLPAGVNKCIGTHEDIQNSRVIYFIWNSNNLHGIYQFNGLDLTISNLFESSILNFQEDFLITGIGLVNNILSWCDNYNENRLLDLNSLSSYSTPYTEEMITLIKRPPMYPPSHQRKRDTLVDLNNIQKKYFQFATRFVFKDKTKSVFSPVSKTSIDEVKYVGRVYTSGSTSIPYTNIEITNNNYIELSLNVPELTSGTFISMVNKVEVLVREGNTGTWSIYKAISTSDVISNSSIFRFYNNTSLISLDQTEYTGLSFDSVPLKSAAHAIIKNRIFLGDNTEGFNIGSNITATISSTKVSTSIINTIALKAFKCGGKYSFGILWKDKYGRHSGVETNSTLDITIPYFASGTFWGGYVDRINVTLSGTPPDWAHSYSIVRTDDLVFDNLLSIQAQQSLYLTGYDSSGNPQYVYSYDPTKTIKEVHLEYYNNENTPYVFTEGDYVRIPTVESTDFITFKYTYKEYKIKGTVYVKSSTGSDIVTKIVIDKQDMGITAIYSSVDIFNYRVKTGLFYEIGYTYPVTNPGTPSRSLSTTAITVIGGDIYIVSRISSRQILFGSTYYDFYSPFESVNLFDEFSRDPVSDIGRPTIELPDSSQQIKQGSIRFSDLYVQGSNINGLSRFQGLNEYNLPYEYGPIYKLQIASNTESDGSVLLSIHSHETASLYIGEVVYSDVAGKNTIGVSNDVIGSARVLRGSFGTMNPESVVLHNGSVYGFDILKGVVWRYAADGLNPISNLKMKNYFYQKSRDIINIENVRVFATFDRYYNEYIISVNDETLAFNEVENRWVTYYSFVPEFYQKVNTKVISFKDGALWIHDSNSTHNNFYGLQYTSKISPVCNVQPMNTKILLNISTSSQDKWVGIAITTPEGQLSDLRNTDYRTNETGYSANVLRDRNTPNIVLPQIPVLHGDLMRDYSFTTLLECTATESTILRFANFNVIPSENNN